MAKASCQDFGRYEGIKSGRSKILQKQLGFKVNDFPSEHSKQLLSSQACGQRLPQSFTMATGNMVRPAAARGSLLEIFSRSGVLMFSSSAKQVKLRSSDEQMFEVTEEVAFESQTVKNMIEGKENLFSCVFWVISEIRA